MKLNQFKFLFVVIMLCLPALSYAQEPDAKSSVFEKDRTDLAVDKAIQFLISQQRDDGAIPVSYTHLTLPTIYSV